jgi:hypothetical protein
MAVEPREKPLVLAHAEKEPLVFYGPPDAIQGTVRLHNTSEEKVRLQGIPVEGASIYGPGGSALEQLRLTARLFPREQAVVPVRFQADPRTPPGTYEMTVRLGDGVRKATVYVTEKVELRVQPSEVFFYTEGELTFQREFVVENAGNVPIRIGGRCQVLLVDRQDLPVALRRGLVEACDQDWQEALKSALCALSREHVGPLTVDREDATLGPGETRMGPVNFTLPDNLRPFRRYEARWGGYHGDVQVSVYVGGFRKPPREPERRKD